MCLRMYAYVWIGVALCGVACLVCVPTVPVWCAQFVPSCVAPSDSGRGPSLWAKDRGGFRTFRQSANSGAPARHPCFHVAATHTLTHTTTFLPPISHTLHPLSQNSAQIRSHAQKYFSKLAAQTARMRQHQHQQHSAVGGEAERGGGSSHHIGYGHPPYGMHAAPAVPLSSSELGHGQVQGGSGFDGAVSFGSGEGNGSGGSYTPRSLAMGESCSVCVSV